MILEEFNKLRTEEVPTDELERSKNMIYADILRGMDNPHEMSEILTYMKIQFRNERSLDDYVRKIKAISSESIMEAANTYLSENCLATVILKPK